MHLIDKGLVDLDTVDIALLYTASDEYPIPKSSIAKQTFTARDIQHDGADFADDSNILRQRDD